MDYERWTFMERVESMTLFVLKKTDLLNSFFLYRNNGIKNITDTRDVFLNSVALF